MSQQIVHETARPASLAWQPNVLMAILFGHFAVFGLIIGVLGVVWAEVMILLALSEGVFGTAQLVLPLVGFLVLLFNGQLYLWLGNKRLSMISLALLAISLIILDRTDSLWWLVISLMLTGAGSAMLDAAMNSAAIDLEQATGRHSMNVLHAVSSGGTVLGAFLTGVLLNMGWSINQVLWSTIVLTIPFIIATAFVRYPPIAANTGESSDVSIRQFLRKLFFIVLAMLCIMGIAVESVAVVWSVIYVQNLNASIAVSAATFALFNGAMLIGRLANASIVARMGARVSLIVSGAGIVLSALMLLLSTNIILTVIAFVVMGLAVAGVHPTVMSASAPLSPNNSGAIAAAIMMAAYVSFIIAPPLYGWLAEFSSLQFAMIIVLICGVLTLWFSIEKRFWRIPSSAENAA